MTQTPCSYDDETQPHPYYPLQDLSGVDATYPHVLPRLTTHTIFTQNDLQLSPAPRDDESNHSRLMNTSYSLVPVGIETLDDTPIDRTNLGFLQSSELRHSWGPFHTSPNLLPSSTDGFPPPDFPHPSLDLAPYCSFTFPQSPLPTGHIQGGPVVEPLHAASSYHPPAIPVQNSTPPSRLPLDHTLKAGSRTLGASYPCQWTEGGVLCNVMVQATRPRMNRHLHEHHGFGGSDTRQTSCNWAGCGGTMQQGSIARHTVTCHFQAKVTCPMCSKKLSRQDVISKHQRICPVASARR